MIPVDTEFELHTIKSVTEEENGYSMNYEDGWSFWCPKRHGIIPKVGDEVKSYGRGIGSPVRGLVVAGKIVYYETESEHRERTKREQEEKDAETQCEYEATLKAEHEARIQKLPLEFQARIGAFRLHNPNWGWRYEDYELFACEEAVKIAATCKTTDGVKKFHALPYERQREMIPDLSDQHSGNTFGSACSFAALYLSHPELIEKQHGALCPLVGCADYGCYASRKEALASAGRDPQQALPEEMLHSEE